MKSTIEPVEHTPDADSNDTGSTGNDTGSSTGNSTPGNKKLVKLSVTIPEDEFERDINNAFRKIAREVKLPGFRAGKAPRRVLEARIGLAAARDQALRDSVPEYLAKAVREHDVDLIATPEVQVTAGEESGPVEFDATCEVRPTVSVPGYGGLRIELPSPTATDEEIDQAVAEEARRQGSLESLDRPIASGDFVTLSLSATRDGEPVPGLNTEDWLYEVGKGWIADGFDDELIGHEADETLHFTLTPKGTSEEADFEVTIDLVQEMVIPEVTDEWVADHVAEFDSVEAWRGALAERIGNGKLAQARNQYLDKVSEALAELVDEDVPDSMVNADLQGRVEQIVRQFQAQGVNLDQWLQATGQNPQTFIEGLRGQSMTAAKVDLALRAVADAEAIEVDDDDIDAEYGRIAVRVQQKKADVRRAYERNDAVAELRAGLRKSKAMDWLVERVEVVDPDGNPLDRQQLLGQPQDHHHDHNHDHHNHDHDHDHEGHDHG